MIAAVISILDITYFSLLKTLITMMAPTSIILKVLLLESFKFMCTQSLVDVRWQNVLQLHIIQMQMHFLAESLYIGWTPLLFLRLKHLHVHLVPIILIIT